MIATDEDALVCDLAETYQVFDYRSLPARFVATLAAGLRESSRIKLKMAGMPCTSETLLLAMAVDRLSLLFWAKTEDGQKNRNRPESICAKLVDAGDNKKTRANTAKYKTMDEFLEMWEKKTGNKGYARRWKQWQLN